MTQLPADLMADPDGKSDVVLMFAQNQRQLAEFLPLALERLGETGSLWIAFLKQSASKATDIDRASITNYAHDFGVTVVAMISVDYDWSALRLKRM